MKALADIKRRQMSTTVAAASLAEDFDYDPAPLAKPSRHGLHAVSLLEMPLRSDSLEVEEEEFARVARRDSQRMISNVSTKLVMRPTFTNKVKATMTTPKLTTEEFIQVRLATVRESTRHCYWPSDVVARFAAADVIR